MDDKVRKAINFDLDTAKLKRYYKNKSYQQAYYEIRNCLALLGFSHRQGSGYVSRDDITMMDIYDDIAIIVNKLPWLIKCARHMDVTNIGPQYDLIPLLGNDTSALDLEKS